MVSPARIIFRSATKQIELYHLFDTALHVESLFILLIMLPVQYLTECLHGIGQLDVLARRTGEHLGYREGLREKALNLARAVHRLLVGLRQLFDTQYGDNVLQILVALQGLLDALSHAVMLFAYDLRIECG